MAEKVNQNRREEEFFKELFQKYYPYWPLFLLVVTLGLGLAFAYGRWVERSYTITARILIKDEKKGIDESQMLKALDVFSGNRIVENEIEVLHSRTLSRQVVRNLCLYAPISQNKDSRMVSAYNYSPVKIQATEPEKIQEENDIPFQYNAQKLTVTIGNQVYPVNRAVQTKWGELSFLTNPNSTNQEASGQYYFSLLNVKKVEEGLLGNLEVTAANKLATVVELSMKDNVPQRGKDILNNLISLYTRSEIEQKNRLAQNILASVNRRIDYVSGQIDSVEDAIQRYRSSEGVIDISAQGRLYLENIGAYDKQLQDVNIKLAVLDEVDKYIRSRNTDATVMPSALGVEDPSLSQMLDKLNTAQSQYDQLKRTTAENSPILLNAKDQIDRLRPAIADMIQSQRTSLQVSKNRLEGQGAKYSSMLSTIPRKERQLLDISREQSVKNQIYAYLLERREEAALSLANATNDSTLVDLAESSVKPTSPNMLFIYGATLLACLLFGLLYVDIREGLNKSVLFRKEIEEKSKVPVIGEIFYTRHASDGPVIHEKEKTLAGEQVRSIRNRLFFANNDSQLVKVLFITSSINGEGKTFLSHNLAVSMALAGRRTLLVDMDVDQYKISKLFDLQSKNGITDLFKKQTDLSSAINRTTTQHLHVLPIGSQQNSSIELFDQHVLENFFTAVRAEYDCVIICYGATSLNANAQAISGYCDSSVFVIRQGITPKAALMMLLNEHKVEGLKNASIVFNGVRKRGIAGKGYGYGYGYGYELKVKA
ncbi:AAA family ATPase [Flavihumibacter rivuli]|uniref:GumC family protein n=1 Tax=Flavihumibacter rivuli TaxID=2838156 RepID=UPI001BDDFDA1|nr:tyrosine-protein kinase [Flavihumibacter rivuli]ULQ57953.1 AAA family ATPase [Flavihumibacter rivuli]